MGKVSVKGNTRGSRPRSGVLIRVIREKNRTPCRFLNGFFSRQFA
jgi:hypothetical protein